MVLTKTGRLLDLLFDNMDENSTLVVVDLDKNTVEPARTARNARKHMPSHELKKLESRLKVSSLLFYGL